MARYRKKAKTSRRRRYGRRRRFSRRTRKGGRAYRNTRGTGMPNTKVVWFTYNDAAAFNNAGFAHGVGYYRLNGAYDVDPLVGTTAMPGFSEYSAFYQKYQVTHAKVHVEIMNLEAFDILAVCGPSPVLNDAGTGTSLNAFLGNKMFTTKVCRGYQAGTSFRRVFNWKGSLTGVLGNAKITGTDTTINQSLVGANPANTINYQYFINTFKPATTFVNGINLYARVSLRVKFYEPLLLSG